MRKHVVEYDDVINKQRETIYAERDKVLHNEDLTDTVRDFLDEEIDVLVDEHLAAEVPDEWNLDGLTPRLAGHGLDADGGRRRSTWDLGTPTRPSSRRSASRPTCSSSASRRARRGDWSWSSGSSCCASSTRCGSST